jgi:hypothetical protein
VPTSMWNERTLLFKDLYVKDILALRRLVGKQSPARFFRDLESTYVSELIEEVRIRVRLKNMDGTVTFCAGGSLSPPRQTLLSLAGMEQEGGRRQDAAYPTLLFLSERQARTSSRKTRRSRGYKFAIEQTPIVRASRLSPVM